MSAITEPRITEGPQWKAFPTADNKTGWVSSVLVDEGGAWIQMVMTPGSPGMMDITAVINDHGNTVEHIWRGYPADDMWSAQCAAIEGRLYEVCQWHGFDYGAILK